eukprot:6307997-Amphidinium_carterae.1
MQNGRICCEAMSSDKVRLADIGAAQAFGKSHLSAAGPWRAAGRAISEAAALNSSAVKASMSPERSHGHKAFAAPEH